MIIEFNAIHPDCENFQEVYSGLQEPILCLAKRSLTPDDIRAIEEFSSGKLHLKFRAIFFSLRQLVLSLILVLSGPIGGV